MPLSFVPAPTIAVEIGIPNSTLYIQNLNEKAKKKGTYFTNSQDLLYMLNTMFSKYGRILDIIIKRRVALRGQAWIVFEKKEQAMKALHSLQGKFLYEKPIVIRYAKWKSDVISKADGTFEQEKAKREAELEAKGGRKLTKREQMIQAMKNDPLGMAFIPANDEFIVPNNVLFIQNLAEGVSEEQLTNLFKQYPGFQEVRLVPGKSDIAFVEYENEYQSNIAKMSLDKYKIDGVNEMAVSFAKK